MIYIAKFSAIKGPYGMGSREFTIDQGLYTKVGQVSEEPIDIVHGHVQFYP